MESNYRKVYKCTISTFRAGISLDIGIIYI